MDVNDTAGAIVAHRNDGMGARIIAMMNAVRVAHDYGVPYFVGWTTHGRTREEVRDPSFIFHPDYIAERFFDVEIMQEIYTDVIDLDTLNDSTSEADFRQMLADGKCFMSGAAMGVTVLPWENADDVAARLPGCIEEFIFSDPVAETIAKIKTTFAGSKLTAYHIRRGDIISDPIASNKLWPNKFIPREYYEQHLDETLLDPAAQVLCFSDTPIEVERLKERGDRVQSFKDLLGDREFTTGARDFLELYAMSRCGQIYGPPSSAFSQTAMVLGGGTLDAVQEALSPAAQSDAMDRMTERLEAKSDLFLNMGDVGQCLHFLIEHQTAKDNTNRAKRIIRDYMEDGLDKSFAYQLLCELSVKSDELDYCERVRDLAYARPVYVDDSMAVVNSYGALNNLVSDNGAKAREQLFCAIWFRPLEPLVQGTLNLALTVNKINPRNFYPFDNDLVRQKASIFPNGKPALSALNVYRPAGLEPDAKLKFHPWDLAVRDWRMVMGKRLNRAFTNRSKIQKTADMLSRAFSKMEGTAPLNSALGVLDRALGNFDDALATQRAAVAANPDNALYRKRLSDVLFDLENDKNAIMQLERASALAGPHPCYMAELGQRYWKLKRRDECAALFDQLFNTEHDFIEIHLATADMLRRDDSRLNDALTSIDRALVLGHGSQRLMSAKARILMLLERVDEAQVLYETIVDSGQGTEHTHVEIYRNFKKLDRVDVAKGLTDRSIYDFDMVVEMAEG